MTESSDQTTTLQGPLEACVRKTIRTDGEEFEGYVWAIRPLKEWADLAGVSESTVKRRFKKPPYDTLTKQVEGTPTKLVRIGEPDHNQPSRLAATMSKIFRDGIILNHKVNAQQIERALREGRKWKPKKAVSRPEYGCLQGLVEDWRPHWQLDIFRHTITPEGWVTFMVEAKSKMVDYSDHGGAFFKLKPGLWLRYFHYPHIKTLRAFWMCAEYAYVQHMIGVVTAAKGPLTGVLAGTDKQFWWDWDAVLDSLYPDWIPETKAKSWPDK